MTLRRAFQDKKYQRTHLNLHSPYSQEKDNQLLNLTNTLNLNYGIPIQQSCSSLWDNTEHTTPTYRQRNSCQKEQQANQGNKFSSNQNFAVNQPYSRQKGSLVGSIKKNKRNISIEDDTNQFMSGELKFDELELIRMSKLSELNEKLSKVINKENIGGDNREFKLTTRPKYKQQIEQQDLYASEVSNYLPQSLKLESPPTKVNSTLQNGQQSSQFNPKIYIEALFDILDGNRIGKLSKSNCKVSNISEEFKFLFGSIFTKIFLKDLVCNKRQFLKLCQNILKQINSDETVHLLKKLDPSLLDSKYIFVNENNQKSFEQFSKISESRRPVSSDRVQKTSSWSERDQKTMRLRRQSQNISESKIKQQKRNLRELSELTKRISNVLTSQQLCDQSQDRLRQEESLRFDQLIKFI